MIAVEPLDGMRAVLERVVPAAEALNGTRGRDPAPERFGRRGLRRRGVSLVRQRRGPDERSPACCGHGGVLAILFNQTDGDFEPKLPKAFWDAYHDLAIEKPPEQTVKTGLWRAPFPGPFEPLTEANYPNPVELDREGVLAQAASWSMIAALPEQERTGLLARLSELVPDEVYRHPLRTDLYWTRLR